MKRLLLAVLLSGTSIAFGSGGGSLNQGDASRGEGLDQFALTPTDVLPFEKLGTGSVLLNIGGSLTDPVLVAGSANPAPSDPTIFVVRDATTGVMRTADNHVDVEVIDGDRIPNAVPHVNESGSAVSFRLNLATDLGDLPNDSTKYLDGTGAYSVPPSSTPSDTAYGSSWNAVTTIPPSKNAVYDWGHTFDTDDDGKVNVLDIGAGITKTDANGVVGLASAGTDYAAATSGSSILYGDGAGGFSSVTVGAGLGFTGGTLSPAIYATSTSSPAPAGPAVGIPFVASVASVNVKAAGTTDIFMVPTGKTYVLINAWIVVTAVTSPGAGVEVWTVRESGASAAMTAGTSSASVSPLVGYTYFQPTTAAGSPFTPCAAGNKVQAVISTSHSGSTAVTGTVYVLGYYY